MKNIGCMAVGVVVSAGLIAGGAQGAGLTLTAAGIADGFSLTTFASGIPNNGTYGPMGTVSTSDGNILVTDFGGAPSTYSFNDIDGQTPGTALANSSVGAPYFGITYSNGKIYAVNYGAGRIDVLNNDGSFNSVLTPLPGGVSPDGSGIATNPANGHLYVNAGAGIVDIDPVAQTIRQVNNQTGDGITVSPDGQTVYIALGGGIQGYNTTTGASTGFSVNIAGADGVAIIASGSIFNNYLVVNANGGFVDLVDPTGAIVTTIADGGSRGDFVGVDNNDGTLFLSQTDSVDRLSCGAGCQFETTSAVPEPGTVFLTMAGLAFMIRKRGAFLNS